MDGPNIVLSDELFHCDEPASDSARFTAKHPEYEDHLVNRTAVNDATEEIDQII